MRRSALWKRIAHISSWRRLGKSVYGLERGTIIPSNLSFQKFSETASLAAWTITNWVNDSLRKHLRVMYKLWERFASRITRDISSESFSTFRVSILSSVGGYGNPSYIGAYGRSGRRTFSFDCTHEGQILGWKIPQSYNISGSLKAQQCPSVSDLRALLPRFNRDCVFAPTRRNYSLNFLAMGSSWGVSSEFFYIIPRVARTLYLTKMEFPLLGCIQSTSMVDDTHFLCLTRCIAMLGDLALVEVL